MLELTLFLVLGLGAGAVYGILGLGLVLKYRSTGVVDFAHGAVAMFGAYVFLGLRSDGILQLPWIWLPHEVRIYPTAMPTWLALLVALSYSAVFGLLVFRIVYRPLLNASALTKVCASVGTMLLLQGIAVLNFGTQGRSTPPLLPSGSLRVGSIQIPTDRLYFAAIVVGLAVLLAWLYRSTRFGLSTRAAAENPTGASLNGLSSARIAAVNWVLASILAALAGILITPISTLDPSSFTLFVIPALAASLAAKFRSFTAAAAVGLALGMAQAQITKLITDLPWLPQQGLPQGVPFILILIAMSVLTKRATARGEAGSSQQPSVGRPRRPALTGALCFLVGMVLLVMLSGSLRVAFIGSLVSVCLCLSVVVLTGYVGQVSLAQMSFAGVTAFVLSHLTITFGVPFPFSLLLAALAAVPIGLLIGLPALRVRGVNLAIVTLAAASAMDALVFGGTWLSGGLAGSRVTNPTLFGVNLGISEGPVYPRLVFGVLVLAIVCAVGVAVARLRNSATGLTFLAIRSNERAAAAAGIDVTRVKLMAFGLSSFVAGLAGGLLAYQQGTVSPATFSAFTSLALLAITYVAGVGRIAGAVTAGVLFSANGLLVTYVDRTLEVGVYQVLLAGFALTITAVKNPDGVAVALSGPVRRLLGPLERRAFARRTSSGSGGTSRDLGDGPGELAPEPSSTAS